MSETTAHVVEVHSKSACVQCTATYKALDKKGMAYKSFDATTEESRAVYAPLGISSAPAVLIRDEDGNVVDHWGGFNPGKVDKWARILVPAPEELAAVA